jgi:hypothetical protein
MGFSSALLTDFFAGCAMEAHGALLKKAKGHGAEKSSEAGGTEAPGIDEVSLDWKS